MTSSTLSKDQIVAELERIIGKQNVVTDAEELKLSSIDRFRRFEGFHGLFRMPLPAAIAMAKSSDDVARVIEFANQNHINVVPRTGRSATEGGLETAVENSIVLDGFANLR
jgi:alkyldihydroxyacetonephosphate synthase